MGAGPLSYPTPVVACAHPRSNDGSMALEPAMRVSQSLLEPALKSIWKPVRPHIDIRFGWRRKFTQNGYGVHALIRCPATGETRRSGPTPRLRRSGQRRRTGLGIGLDYIDLRRLVSANSASADSCRRRSGLISTTAKSRWTVGFTSSISPRLTVTYSSGSARPGTPNRLEGWTLISQNDRETWTLHAPLGAGTDADAIEPKSFCSDLGTDSTATSSRQRLEAAVVARQSYGIGRVWLAGDAVHQFPRGRIRHEHRGRGCRWAGLDARRHRAGLGGPAPTLRLRN